MPWRRNRAGHPVLLGTCRFCGRSGLRVGPVGSYLDGGLVDHCQEEHPTDYRRMMMDKDLEGVRREMAARINEEEAEREKLEGLHGQVWDTRQLTADFNVVGFSAPFVVVTRKSDGVKGSLTFQHRPRFYWGFVPA